MDEFNRRANDVAILVKIENKEGLDNADEMLSVPGIDIVSVGRNDLSKSLGMKRDHPLIAEATQRVFRLAVSAGVALLRVAETAEELGEWVDKEQNLRSFYLSTDGTQIGYHFRSLVKCNEHIAQSVKGRGQETVS